jgi:hypothetical protein
MIVGPFDRREDAVQAHAAWQARCPSHTVELQDDGNGGWTVVIREPVKIVFPVRPLGGGRP